MTDYKPTPHIPDDEGRRLISELWALYSETGFNNETGKPLKLPRADADFWKMRQAEQSCSRRSSVSRAASRTMRAFRLGCHNRVAGNASTATTHCGCRAT